MEALRLLSNAAQMLPELIVARDSVTASELLELTAPPVPNDTWDAALVQTQLADILGTELRGRMLRH